MLGLRAICRWSVCENPSRACLVLPGALRICPARYFTTPSCQQGLDIDRAITLTGTSRILDEANAGQSARMPAKLCPAWLSAIKLRVAPDKSVKTCQEFGQGSVKDGQGFEGRISISGLLMWLSEPPAAGHTPNSGRGDYLACYADRSEPLIAVVPGLGLIAFRGAIRPELSRIICLLTIGPDCPRRPAQQCPGE